MQRPDRIKETALEWLRRAASNLARAKQEKPIDAVWEDICFDAQQAAEKALKAICILNKIRFPLTHDIGDLFDILSSQNIAPPPNHKALRYLTEYAVATRYPGWGPPVTKEEAEKAIADAETIFGWASDQLQK